MSNKQIDNTRISPRALRIIEDLGYTTGFEEPSRIVEELAFAMKDMLDVIDLAKDPLLEPETARRQTETIRGVLQKFKRYPLPK